MQAEDIDITGLLFSKDNCKNSKTVKRSQHDNKLQVNAQNNRPIGKQI